MEGERVNLVRILILWVYPNSYSLFSVTGTSKLDEWYGFCQGLGVLDESLTAESSVE